MDRDNARNAKAEIFASAFGYEEFAPIAEGRTIPHFQMSNDMLATAFAAATNGDFGRLALSPRKIPVAVAPPVAVGIAPRSRDGDGGEKIVLLSTHKSFAKHPMVERAMEIAKGEAEFVFTGPVRAYSYWVPAYRRPLAPGMSIGHVAAATGTLGGFVVRLGTPSPCLLSNNHVLANVNDGLIGDAIHQPGIVDGGNGAAFRVGQLSDFVPIDFGAGRVNLVDCAVAEPDELAPLSAISLANGQAGATPIVGAYGGDTQAGDLVFKVGRTTGLTRGVVFAEEIDNYLVNLGSNSRPRMARFDDQFTIMGEGGDFSQPGDSGSLVVDYDGHARGLLFAGSAAGAPNGFGLTAANPIATVLSELSATLWTG